MSFINKFKPPTAVEIEEKEVSTKDTKEAPANLASSREIKTPKSKTEKRVRRSKSEPEVSKIYSETALYNGEKIMKTDTLIEAVGALEELIAHIGIVKAEYYGSGGGNKINDVDNKEITNSGKLFSYARFTKIQEALHDILLSITTTKKVSIRYEASRFSVNAENHMKDLEQEIQKMEINGKNYLNNIPGVTELEARLMLIRTLCRKAERRLLTLLNEEGDKKNLEKTKNFSLDIVPEDSCFLFLNRLSDYFLVLAVYNLQILHKEPMKHTKDRSRRNGGN